MELKYEKKDVYQTLNEQDLKNVDMYSKEYIDFLNNCKTERLCTQKAIEMLDANGFVDISKREKLVYGDKVYFVNKEKSLFAAVIGKTNLISGVNIIGAHIDSPRLDLKPFPLYETASIALLKTQYYGGIKKYQWMSIPLSMYGIIYDENGNKINIAIGDDDEDPCFTITDLLPHLAKDQMKPNASEFIDPEKMNILFGNIKDKDAKESKVKSTVLKILNEKYGIKEIDFARSDIEFVPSHKAKYLGIDKSMIAGYGQDDRVCAYATLKAIIDSSKDSNNYFKTMVAMIVDKEEIGSYGNTSMSTEAFDMFMNKILNKTGNLDVDKLEIYYNSSMLSADVTAGLNPNYEEVSDNQNANIIGSGVAIEKYGGGRGKSGASEASAEYVTNIMKIFDNAKVSYQLGTLGKSEKGGGGTIAFILANKGIDVVDCGTPVLSMHSPFEVTSKFDVYMTYLAYKAFFENEK